MNRYDIFKFLHVLAAVVWVGSGTGLFAYGLRLRASADRQGLLSLGRASESLGKTLFGPAAGATLVFGILMVATEPHLSFADLWIVIGFVGIGISVVLGAVLGERADKQLAVMLADPGTDQAVIDRQLTKSMRVNSADLAVLIVVIWAMVAKPVL